MYDRTGAAHRGLFRFSPAKKGLVQPGGITPWHASFKAAGLYSGKICYILGKSGHIAGVMN